MNCSPVISVKLLRIFKKLKKPTMALPSSRRPVHVEQEIEAESQVIQKKKLDKKAIFMDALEGWVTRMDKAKLNRMTASKLKLKALEQCDYLKIEYDRLPLDWVARLIERTGLRLRHRKKKPAQVFEGQIEVLVDPMKVSAKNAVEVIEQFGPEVTAKIRGQNAKAEAEVEMIKEKAKRNPGYRWKEIVDLSKEPPPADWIKSLVEGKPRPRTLDACERGDKLVIFYRYDPKYKFASEEDRKRVLGQKGDPVTWTDGKTYNYGFDFFGGSIEKWMEENATVNEN